MPRLWRKNIEEIKKELRKREAVIKESTDPDRDLLLLIQETLLVSEMTAKKYLNDLYRLGIVKNENGKIILVR